MRSWTHTDGFGRTIDAFTRDPQGDVRTTTAYDGLGRTKRVTNPYRSTSDPTYGYADTTYDMMGRVRFVTTYDSGGNPTGTVTTDYLGSQVTVIDQAGKVRRSVSDGLGRLKQVIEDPFGSALAEVGDPVHELGPVRGACLSLFTEREHRFLASVVPDEKGHFTINSIRPGRYRLVVRAHPLCVANVPLRVVSWPRGGLFTGKRLVIHMRPAGIDRCSHGDYK